eukprot:CAMPEP_0174335116 /NCGR_PEP_ID=MMETSP0810-20121108/20514_1 /TAXON_ID=73025 ORGANISM="Eutreptiella gymnastica-like, Strain CCMP1594" /NCGR_SAMPLE_ID=MMETSP0810 /ASSEMBLY_ACC=CAM_ASM_000659 /LENGTH=211 /DNA_ID=CAMNT_0015453279 /DNA_START=23 /DNA_END=659 /DNA_ORIENTATION=+
MAQSGEAPLMTPWKVGAVDDERVRILDRLASKLLDSRMIEERERLITELARQESELCHLRAALKEQTQANEEAHIAMKNQEKVIQELKAQGKDPTAEKTVELLQKQLMEKESALKLLEASNKQLQDQVEKAKKPAEQAAIPTEFDAQPGAHGREAGDDAGPGTAGSLCMGKGERAAKPGLSVLGGTSQGVAVRRLPAVEHPPVVPFLRLLC